MNIIITTLQIVVALGILNVWLLRYGKETKWRGGTAKNMKQEFATYGLPVWAMITTGVVKVSLATLLIIGIWVPVVVVPAATLLTMFMTAAVLMHIKVGDPIRKSFPALAILVLSAAIVLLS